MDDGTSSLVVDVSSLRYRSQYRTVIGQLEETFYVGTEANPEPIGFDLVVVSDLLDAAHWQNIDDYKSRGLCPASSEAALDFIRNNLEQAIVEYPNRTGAAVPTCKYRSKYMHDDHAYRSCTIVLLTSCRLWDYFIWCLLI